ncbi:hypothetical protein [Rhizobium sp. PP-CC-3G-465]|uniref:hypothetical protein n=1 Tax=Rhizobium sp. PP-CC-3G-465 TaxID=2135648 RepID=UPI0010CED1AB|nr:hypothetical protein C8J33_101902 [Rhizobium sp. PP-CC-3G-465]
MRERNERMSLAWHIAKLDRVKKMPALKDMLTVKKTRVRQTPEEIEAVTRSWLGSRSKKEKRGISASDAFNSN